MNPIKTVEVEGKFLSPVHVGWGQELDPFSCFIRENRLYYFDLGNVLQEISESEKNEFISLVKKDSLTEIRKFIANRLDISSHALGSIEVSKSLASEYAEKIDDPHNQLIFQPFFRNKHRLNPVLPGSSLKGAIRTAVIDTLIASKEKGLSEAARKDSRKMESEALGNDSIESDPFKALKVEDIDIETGATVLYPVFNYSLDCDTPKNLGLRIETTKSFLDGADITFKTHIIFFEAFKNRFIRGRNGNFQGTVSQYLDPKKVLSSCRMFYDNNLEEEHRQFYAGSPYKEQSLKLIKIARELETDECLLRLGRFTQAESKSINSYRKITVRGKDGCNRVENFGTTRNLADGLFPMGWIKLRFKDIKIENIKERKQEMAVFRDYRQAEKQKAKTSGSCSKAQSPLDLSVLRDKFRVIEKKDRKKQ